MFIPSEFESVRFVAWCYNTECLRLHFQDYTNQLSGKFSIAYKLPICKPEEKISFEIENRLMSLLTIEILKKKKTKNWIHLSQCNASIVLTSVFDCEKFSSVEHRPRFN